MKIADSQKPIVLMADEHFPRPDRDSGSLDQLSFVGIFQSLGFEVHFVAINELKPEFLSNPGSHCPAMMSSGVRCVTERDFRSLDEYLCRLGGRIALAFLSRHSVASVFLDPVREFLPGAKIIFNAVDLHFLRQEREASLTGNPQALVLAKASKEKELASIEQADAAVVVSTYEREVLRDIGVRKNVHVIPLIREFSAGQLPGFASRRNIAFVGGYAHTPNVDAVEWFLSQVWPQLHARCSGMKFLVAGSQMPPSLSSRSDEGVEFVGYVRDLGAFLGSIRLTVAPLRYGAGAKGKLVSSLGHGVPCIASPIAAEGMGLEEGCEIAVARTPEEFVDLVGALYDDETQWSERARAGRMKILSDYSVERGTKLVRDLLCDAGVKLH